jgi:hypothetical protein
MVNPHGFRPRLIKCEKDARKGVQGRNLCLLERSLEWQDVDYQCFNWINDES